MNTLQSCYEINFSKINFIARKLKITYPKTILKGPSGVGKTYLIYDFLTFIPDNKYIYIDLEDPRNNLEEIKFNLESFINENEINTLVLENFLFDFNLPYCENIIITSTCSATLPDFKVLNIKPLEFEEYLLHDNKSQQTTHSFNNFLKYGNLPEIIHLPEHKKIKKLQEILFLQTKNSTHYEILKLLIKNIDEKKSLFQLFNTLKKEIKISKDLFYKTCKNLEENQTIYFLQKHKQKNALKKIYCYNHSFFTAVTYDKKFKNEFTNMIFLHLTYKHQEIFYLDYIDFFIPKIYLGIICIPFYNHILMNKNLKKIIKNATENNIKELYIITISNNQLILEYDIPITILPFYEWALI